MITLITCTGGRPEAFALCERWMRAQIYWPDLQWIVVDDCVPETECTMGQTVLRPCDVWEPGRNTLTRNLVIALQYVMGDVVLFIEDDDWYSPHYIERMDYMLDTFEFVGRWHTRLYHASLRHYQELMNEDRGSMFETGFKAIHLPLVMKAVLSAGDCTKLYHDRAFWTAIKEKFPVEKYYLHHEPISVGIKGMPGRGGISGAHRAIGFEDDPEGMKLREWLGSDADVYLNMQYPNVRKHRIGEYEIAEILN